jgi:hypothetical protein
MTLKEKFGNVELDDPYIFMKECDAEECEKIANEFAIGFAEWIHSNAGYAGNGHYVVIGNTSYHTIPKLLEIYKKEKAYV